MRILLFTGLFTIVAASSLLSQANHVVISEVYGGGGNSGSKWKNDFVELYNPTNAPISVEGWSVQYASASGAFGQSITVLAGVIQPKSYYLVQELVGAGGTQDLPAPDAIGIIAMSSSSGKVALARTSSAVSGPTDPSVVDFLGYGTPNMSEGSAGPTLSNTTSAERKASASSTASTLGPGGSEEKAGNGYDTDNNANDFVAQSAINPQNSSSPQEPPPSILSGIGSALFRTAVVKADTAFEITLVVKGSSAGSISAIRFSKHPLLNWSRSKTTVSLSGVGTAVVLDSLNSVTISAVSLGASDSAQIRIAGLAAPDTTAKIVFRVETGPSSDLTTAITPLPSFVLYGNPRPIALAKANDAQGVPLNLQQPVTVHGIVTVAAQLGGPAYLQDASGGLAAFDQAFESAVKIGDEVAITGIVTQYNGLTELANVTLHKIYSSGNEVVPLVVTASQLSRDGVNGVEMYEGLLVQLDKVTVRDAQGQVISVWSVSTSGSNFWLHDALDSVQVRIDADVTTLANQAAPTGEFDIIGVVGQFVSASPYIGGYQLMPRSGADVLSKGPVITVNPLEDHITSSSFDITWQTARPGSSFVRYGRTKSYELGTLGSSLLQTAHTSTISGLTAATVYHVQAFSVGGTDTSFAGDRVVSTASPASSGQINVYFNKSINSSLARGEGANGNANLTDLLVRRINAAQKSVDCALYSFSGQPGQTIANALVQAAARGVKVRFMIERDNLNAGSGYPVNQILIPAGIPVISDDFDPVNAGVGLMHNKFFIIDYRGGAPDKVWVWTGSWNPTDPGTNDDMQNSIEIQDQAIAGAYTIEFNEMWGSDTDVPDAANSRFGARKLDNTPHIFVINGLRIELYFSPSDRTTSHILSTLDKAGSSINMALLTLTRSDIAAELKSRKDAGVRIRGVLDNNTDSGSQFAFLKTAGADMLLDLNTNALLHHKYALVDAELSTATQFVITGSHNWTTAAETSNNENMLIIQSNRIANLYIQEFAARYKDAGGADNLVVSVQQPTAELPRSFSLSQNFPNPFNGTTNFVMQIANAGLVTLKVYDLLGREVATLLQESKQPGSYTVRWSAGDIPSGTYFCELRQGQSMMVRTLVLLK